MSRTTRSKVFISKLEKAEPVRTIPRTTRAKEKRLTLKEIEAIFGLESDEEDD